MLMLPSVLFVYTMGFKLPSSDVTHHEFVLHEAIFVNNILHLPYNYLVFQEKGVWHLGKQETLSSFQVFRR